MSSDVARRWQQGFEAYKKASGTVGTMQGLVSETKRAHFIDYDELVSDSDADELSDDDDDGYYNRHDDDGDQDVESRSSFGGTNSSKRRCFLCVCTAKSFRLWWRRWRQHLWDLVVALLPVCDGAHTLQIALEGSFWRVIFFTIVLLTSLSITTFAFAGCGADASGSDLLEDAAVDVVDAAGTLHPLLLGDALPCMLRNLLWSGLTSAALPVALGNALFSINLFPNLNQRELPEYGLWLHLPAPLAMLLPVLAFGPLIGCAACASLLLSGASIATPVSTLGSAFNSLEFAAVAGNAAIVSIASTWTTLVRLSLNQQRDDLLCV